MTGSIKVVWHTLCFKYSDLVKKSIQTNIMNKKLLSILIVSGLIFGASQAFSSPVNITVKDNDPVATSFGGGPFDSNLFSDPDGPGLLTGDREDNETEHGTLAGQDWDLEAFVVDGSTMYLVGGYNFLTGKDGYTPGDLFIKVDNELSGTPGFLPTSNVSTTVDNSVYKYDYVVDLTQPTGQGVISGSATTYALSHAASGSIFNTVTYDDRGANPWTYRSGGSFESLSGVTYTTGHADGSAALVNLGLGHLVGGTHNILRIDLSFLDADVGTAVYFSYTMKCGNDSLKGVYDGGFDRVPDESASLLLIGLGLAALSFVSLKRRQS